MKHLKINTNRKSKKRKGILSGEVVFYLFIVGMLMIGGAMLWNGAMLDSRAPKVGEELQRFALRAQTTLSAGTARPYEGIGTENLARALGSSSIIRVLNDTTLEHRLGGGADGLIKVSEYNNGEAFQIELSNVNSQLCPLLSSMMEPLSDIVEINGTTVKEISFTTGVTATEYNMLFAEKQCTSRDTNTFTFIVR